MKKAQIMTRIIVADDHKFFRKGVVMTINSFQGMNVVGEASNGKELLSKIDELKPDIVLIDIKMPEMNGIEATRIAMKQNPALKIIAFSMFGEEEYLQSMLEAGICGFLLKNTNEEGLRRALQQVAIGNQYFSEEFLPYFTKKFINQSDKETPNKITKRELEVLQLIAKGFTNKEIAEKLYISAKTVNNHRASLNLKTGSKNTVLLLMYAIKNNLL